MLIIDFELLNFADFVSVSLVMPENCCTTCDDLEKCQTLVSVMQFILDQDVSGNWIIYLQGNHSSDDKEKVVVRNTPSVKSVTIMCEDQCSLEVSLRLWAQYFDNHIKIVFANMILLDSQIVVQNCHLAFRNVHFVDSWLGDDSPRPGEFGEIMIIFSFVSFFTVKNENANHISVLNFQKSFIVSLHVFKSEFTQSKLFINSSHVFLSFSDTKYFQSHIVLQADITVMSYFSSVAFVKGHELKMRAKKIKANFVDCTVVEFGGISLQTNSLGSFSSWIEVEVQSCSFLNTSKGGIGGVLEITFTSESDNDNSLSIVNVVNSYFKNNSLHRAGALYAFGGAVSISASSKEQFHIKVQVMLVGCRFVDNTAEDGGGAIYFSGEAIDAKIEQCEFSFEGEQPRSMLTGVFLHSFSRASLVNSQLNYKSNIMDRKPYLISLNMRNPLLSIGKIHVTVNCPQWHRMGTQCSHKSNHSVLQSVLLFCDDCAPSHYTPSNGTHHLSCSSDFEQDVQESSPCISCPSGGQCSGNNIMAKPNFWGDHTSKGIVFYQCPMGYCCAGTTQSPCTSFNSCRGGRYGVLCSVCKSGLSQSLLSTTCMESPKCNDRWLWAAAVFGAFAYMLWYTAKDDAFMIPVLTWRKLRKYFKQAEKHPQENTKLIYIDKGYFGILIYFVQVTAILRLDLNDTSNNVSKLLREVETNLGLLLTIELSYMQVDVCPVTDLSMTDKMTAKLVFLSGIFASWGLLFVVFCATRILISHVLDNPGDKFISLEGKLVGGLVKIIKYSYGGVAKIIFFSMTCISLNRQSVWFHDASVKCFSPWQKSMLLLAVTHIVPFPIMLYFGMKLLERQLISGRQLLLGSLLPLLFLFLWGVHLILIKFRNNVLPITTNVNSDAWLGTEADKKMYNRFKRGYRNEGGAQYWECVVMLRRLLLNIVTLVSGHVLKYGVCLVLCIVFSFHHIYMQPFIHLQSNRLETVSLFSLCVQAIISLAKAFCVNAGLYMDGTQGELLQQLSVLESSFLPCLIFILFLLEFVQSIKKRM